MAAVYRFRLIHEDTEDFYRDIDILSNQTFEDFHNAILKSINFNDKQLASFYMSDDHWRRGQEITLMDMGAEENGTLMKDEMLANRIDDPHQRYIYVYDYLDLWTFNLELIKILPQPEPKEKYPKVSKAVGDAPLQFEKGHILATNAIFDDDEFADVQGNMVSDEDGDLNEGFGEEENEESEFGEGGYDSDEKLF